MDMNLRNSLFSLGMILSLSACSFGLNLTPKEQTFFTLEAADENQPQLATPIPFDLVVRNTSASPFLSGRKIIFASSPRVRGYYQFASWVEPLPKQFSSLLLESLRRSNLFRTIAKSTLSARGDMELVTELVDCFHTTSNPPGMVEIVVDADLIDSRTGVVLAHKRFQKSVPSQTFDVEGAVLGIQSGVYLIINDIRNWLQESASAILEKNSLAAEAKLPKKELR